MRIWYGSLHEYVDQLSGMWGDYEARWGAVFITEDESAVIHGRIDDEVKAQGYWDNDLPAHWWREHHQAGL